MNRRSLVFQLAAWHTLLLCGMYLLAGAGGYLVLKQTLRSSISDGNLRRIVQIEAILRDTPAGTGAAPIAALVETRLAPESNSRFVRIVRFPGELVFLSGPPSNQSFDPARLAAGAAESAAQSQRVLIDSRDVGTTSGSYHIEVGGSLASMDEVLWHMRRLLGTLLPVLLGLAAAVGYLLVVRALRSVEQMTQTAEQISLQNLTLRLPVVHSGDALEHLAVALNKMLARLSEAVQTSRRFVADASHELRTPLTIIKGELQMMVGEAHWNEGDVRDRLGGVLEEVARLEHLVAGLLAISRLDAGHMAASWSDVDLEKLVETTAEQMRLMAEERGVDLDLTRLGATQVRGDASQLKQVVVNLLDNAIRFTPRGGRVSVATSGHGDGGLLEVADTGIGIPPEALPHVFERFFRVDEARSRDEGGGGLGLSIVKSICTLHGAQVTVRSEPGRGSTFRITFPRRGKS